jgi:hypothetical protein
MVLSLALSFAVARYTVQQKTIGEPQKMRTTKSAVAVLLMSFSVTPMGAQKEKAFSKPVSVSVTIVSGKSYSNKDLAIGLLVSPLMIGKRGYAVEITYPDGHKTTAFLIQDGTAPLEIGHTYQTMRKKDYVSIETDRPDPRNPSKNRIDTYPIRDEVPQS